MKHGFTLLELSIVLVIIGLIVGGITVGQDLIRSAEIKSVVSDVSRYRTALNTFRSKYNALPGDMDNASSYWPADCTDDGATNPCDGDGDGFIESQVASGENMSRESMRLWQHLNLSEILPGGYDGEDNFCLTNTNCLSWHPTRENTLPKGALNQFYLIRGDQDKISITPLLSVLGQTAMFWYQLKNTGATAGYGTLSAIGIYLPEEQYALDVKMDDGLARTGKVLGGAHATCANTTTGVYDLSSNSTNCPFTFLP